MSTPTDPTFPGAAERRQEPSASLASLRQQKGSGLRPETPSAMGVASLETGVTAALAAQGVFKGFRGLEGLAAADSFWEGQEYGTRLYYGDGVSDYLHRDVLRAAIRALSGQGAEPVCRKLPRPRAAKLSQRFKNCIGMRLMLSTQSTTTTQPPEKRLLGTTDPGIIRTTLNAVIGLRKNGLSTPPHLKAPM
jgi:hypothetical protein